jgi:hypothetical protein
VLVAAACPESGFVILRGCLCCLVRVVQQHVCVSGQAEKVDDLKKDLEENANRLGTCLRERDEQEEVLRELNEKVKRGFCGSYLS